MKLVNPIGKEPVKKSDLKSYACWCSKDEKPAPNATFFGHGDCSHCGCGCTSGPDTYTANSNMALATMRV